MSPNQAALYTIILEFRGGTYIRQVRATGPLHALQEWANQITAGEIRGLGPCSIGKIRSALANAENDSYAPVAISGMLNVWCANLPHFHGTLLNLIKTDA